MPHSRRHLGALAEDVGAEVVARYLAVSGQLDVPGTFRCDALPPMNPLAHGHGRDTQFGRKSRLVAEKSHCRLNAHADTKPLVEYLVNHRSVSTTSETAHDQRMNNGLEIVRILASEMKRKGVKKADIARACNISEQAVGRWFGTGRVSKQNLLVAARMVEMTIDQLMTGETAKTRTEPDTLPGRYLLAGDGIREQMTQHESPTTSLHAHRPGSRPEPAVHPFQRPARQPAGKALPLIPGIA